MIPQIGGGFLSPYLATRMAIKGIKTTMPGLISFFAAASAAGYTAEQAMQFIRERREGALNVARNAEYSKRAEQGLLSPEERALYQKQEIMKRPERLAHGLGSAFAGMGAAAAASAMFSGEDQQKIPEEKAEARDEEETIIGKRAKPEEGDFDQLMSVVKSFSDQGLSPDQIRNNLMAMKKPNFSSLLKRMAKGNKTTISNLIMMLTQGNIQQKTPQAQPMGQPGKSSQEQDFLNALDLLRNV